MRKSFNCEWLKNSDGTLVGINLGSDHCAEHEQDVPTLKSLLGVNDSPKSSVLGIERRRITQLNLDQMTFLDSKNKKTGFSALVFGRDLNRPKTKTDLPEGIKPYRGKKEPTPLSCAWSERDFGVYTDTPDGRDYLRILVAAIQNKEVAIWTGGSVPFSSGGLCIAIIAKASEENKEVMRSCDEDVQNVEKAREELEAEVQLSVTLKEAGKNYMALSPFWSTKIKSTSRGELTTKHKLIFWLNPWDQKRNNHGYYTVEELLEWANNRGPIPIVEVSKTA